MKVFHCVPFDNTRKMVKYIKENKIIHEDIVAIFVLGNTLYLSYYN